MDRPDGTAFMAKNLLTQIFGSRNDRLLKQYRKTAERISALEPQFEKLSDDELRGKTQEFRDRVVNGAALEDHGCVSAFQSGGLCRLPHDRVSGTDGAL